MAEKHMLAGELGVWLCGCKVSGTIQIGLHD